MQDFSQLLKDNVKNIAQRWVDAVSRDRRIPSAETLDRSAIQDHIDYVLNAMATTLSQTEVDDIETVAKASIAHGVLRANQGFDPTEIAQEYHLLRKTILDVLRADLLTGTSEELFRAIVVVDSVVDAAISQCFESYMSERLTELNQVQHQLSMTVTEMKRLVQANQENLSILAHEMKAPLTSIIGYADLFLRQSRLEEGRDSVASLEHIERVLRGGRKLLHVINDALELSRYEAGKLSIDPESTDIRLIVQTVVEAMQPLANDRQLQLMTQLDQAPDEVITDPIRLQQILTNLVSNAVRYTETGSVTIASNVLDSDRWSLSVTDTGIGIAPEDQLRLFNPFVRAELSEQPPPPDSTGLGLAIVARLVELLNGRIYFTSQIKEGSTFMVIFPMEL
jgi:signal transduction histidine kinase